MLSKKYYKKNSVRKNLTPKIEVGQTLETDDLFLPHNKNRLLKSKNRPVITAYINKFGELVVIPGSTQDTPNTTKYGKYGLKYYRNVIEIVDDENKPIKVGKKFKVTDNCTKLPVKETRFIADQVINHTRNSSENRRKLEEFNNRHKKGRTK